MDQNLSTGFLEAVSKLLESDQAEITPAQLRRGTSSLYYSVFHALCRAFADALVGPNPEGGLINAWVEAYRALDHNKCKEACDKIPDRFPEGVRSLCTDIQQLYRHRLKADYDPTFEPSYFGLSSYFGTAEKAVNDIQDMSERDIKALAIWMLVHSRGAQLARTAVSQAEKDAAKAAKSD